jgi:hypothetical protein
MEFHGRAPRNGGDGVSRAMKRIWLAAILIIVFALAGLAVFMTFWDIPPPTAPVEVEIPNDRFPK